MAAVFIWNYDMQVYILEILEHWFIHENGKQQVRKKRNVTTWADKDDLFSELMKWIDTKENNLDEGLVFASRSIAASEGMANWDKLVRIAAILNRFSKFAAELNSKQEPRGLHGPRTTWVEISSIETKLRGSAFE